MKVYVNHWYPLGGLGGVPQPGIAELSAVEIVALSSICDVAIMNRKDHRTRRGKARNDPPFDATPTLALDVKGGRFRQR